MSSSRSSRRPRGTVPLEDLAFQERDSVFRAPNGGDWMLLGLVTLGLLGTGLYDWFRLGIPDHTGRAVFFGLVLVAVYWGALVYIFKLSMCVQVGPHGISLVRGPWRTELFWRDTARLVERTLPDGGQRFRWVVVLARDGRELRVREDMVANYGRFRAEVYERYLLWRDHGGTWGASGTGPFTATDIIANTVVWWLFAAAMVLLPGLYFWFLLPETGLTGLALIAVTAFCCLEALLTFLGRQTYSVGPKEITRKRPAQPTTHLRWHNVSRIDRSRHPAGGLIRVAIAIGQLLMAMAARTDSRFKSFAWSPRVPEYLTLRGEGRHVRIRLHRLSRPDEMLAWVEYYERIGRQRAASQSRPVSASQPGAASHPAAQVPQPTPITYDNIPAGVAGAGPIDPWANGQDGDLTDSYPTEVQPAVGPGRVPSHPGAQSGAYPGGGDLPSDLPPALAAALAAGQDTRSDDDSWLWDTNKLPKVSASSSAPNIFARPPVPPQRSDSESQPTAPSFTPPPTAGPVFTPPSTGGAPAETPWWMTHDAPASPAASAAPSWDAQAPSWNPEDIYPPVSPPAFPPGYSGQPDNASQPEYQPVPEYPPVSPAGAAPQQPDPDDDYPRRMPPFVRQPDYPQAAYSEPPEEQGPSERDLYDENLSQSQKWRAQQNWQRPQLPRFGPSPEGDDGQRTQ